MPSRLPIDRSLTAAELKRAGLLDALASMFYEPTSAQGLLTSIGYPRERLPNFSSLDAVMTWRHVVEEIQSGILTYGGDSRQLLAAAAGRCPYNEKFAPWRGEELGLGRRFSLAVTFGDGRIRNGDLEQICNFASELPFEVGYATNGTIILDLLNFEKDQVTLLADRLSKLIGDRAVLRLAKSGYYGYLLGVCVEKSGKRWLARNWRLPSAFDRR